LGEIRTPSRVKRGTKGESAGGKSVEEGRSTRTPAQFKERDKGTRAIKMEGNR
jgi:hypothetical protein